MKVMQSRDEEEDWLERLHEEDGVVQKELVHYAWGDMDVERDNRGRFTGSTSQAMNRDAPGGRSVYPGMGSPVDADDAAFAALRAATRDLTPASTSLTAGEILEAAGTSMAAVRKLLRPHAATLVDAMALLRDAFPTASVVGRRKAAASLHAKIVKNNLPEDTEIWDVVGTTVIVDDVAAIDGAMDTAEASGLRLVEGNSEFWGHSEGRYRARHFEMDVGGAPVEVQVMTRAAHAVKSWSHPLGYKPNPAWGEDTSSVLDAYVAEVWGVVNRADDESRRITPEELPACPRDTVEGVGARCFEDVLASREQGT